MFAFRHVGPGLNLNVDRPNVKIRGGKDSNKTASESKAKHEMSIKHLFSR